MSATYTNTDDAIAKPSPRELQLEQELAVARARISELEQHVSMLETELSQKRKAEASVPPDSSKKAKTVSPAPAKSQQFVCARLKQNIKNSLKGIKFYKGWDAVDRKVNINDVLSMEEFLAVFGNQGKLIQPTATNKPNSSVHIKELDQEDIATILGTNEFKGELWTKGGQVQGGGFFLREGFSKSVKINGGCQVILQQAEVKYSANNGKLLMKCTFANKTLFTDFDADMLF
jgi:hypothetical protein